MHGKAKKIKKLQAIQYNVMARWLGLDS